VLPGFVTLTIKERTHEVPSAMPAFDRLQPDLYYSALVYLAPALVIGIARLERRRAAPLRPRRQRPARPARRRRRAAIGLPLTVATASRWWSTSPLRERVLRARHISQAGR
jgi:hypothetical protein